MHHFFFQYMADSQNAINNYTIWASSFLTRFMITLRIDADCLLSNFTTLLEYRYCVIWLRDMEPTLTCNIQQQFCLAMGTLQ